MTTVRNIYEQCKSAGVINTQTDFDTLCGRKGNWASSAMARGLDMPLDSLTACYCQLLTRRDVHDVAELLTALWNNVCQMVLHRHRKINRG